MIEERLLRYAAPELYKKMLEIFSIHHIHIYDVHAYVQKHENGMEVIVRFSADFSQTVTKKISSEQAENPDLEVTQFFEEAAQKCKTMLIANYYKMIKL